LWAKSIQIPFALSCPHLVGEPNHEKPLGSVLIQFRPPHLIHLLLYFLSPLSTHSTDRVTQVQLLADGSMSFISDSTMAVDVQGSWRPAEGGKVAFLVERFYATNADSKYSMVRIYEGIITVSDKSIRGEGKIEQEKYDSLFPCGFFSLISVDDCPDDFFEKLGPGHAVVRGVDQ